jgi:hypothetical protein
MRIAAARINGGVHVVVFVGVMALAIAVKPGPFMASGRGVGCAVVYNGILPCVDLSRLQIRTRCGNVEAMPGTAPQASRSHDSEPLTLAC